LGAGAQPGVGPVRRRQREQRGRCVVEIRPQVAELAALAEERAESLLVTATLRDELLAPLAVEVAPLSHEDGRDIELLGNDAKMGTQRGLDPIHDRSLVRNRVERRVERGRAFARDLPEQVGLRLDVCVERALLDSEGLREITDRGAVIALLREETGGSAG